MHSFLRFFARNVQSGVTVALVSIPLSVSLAIASNATPVMGIVTAVWAGLMGAVFGGSRFNILGPAAALSGVIASYALTHGVEPLPWIAFCTGVVVLGAWLLGWDKYIAFIPGSVVHGFTLAVALIIGLNQTNFALGLSGLPQHKEFVLNVAESFAHAGAAHLPTVVVFLTGLAFLFAWSRFVPRVPGPIPLAVVGIVLGAVSAQGHGIDGLQTLYTKFGEFDTALARVPSLSFSSFLDRDFASVTLTVALIAMLETLLSAKVADGMTRTKFDRSREMLGLGIANVVVGLVGGLPATGVFARTAINVKSGATHRMSQGMNAVAVGVICFFFLSQFRYLPLSVVASILVFSSTRMVQKEHFIRLFRHDKSGFGLSILVAALSVAFDPMMGILAGAAASLLFFVHAMSKGQAEVTVNRKGSIVARMSVFSFLRARSDQGDVFVYRFAGPLTYVNAQAHVEALDRVVEPHSVVLALRNVFFMDCDGVDALESILESLESRGKRVAFTGVGELLEPLLSHHAFYARKKKEGLVFASSSEAARSLA